MLSLVMAAVGIAFLVIALGGEFRIRAGLDVDGALNHEGVVAFIFSGFIVYVFRLIFWGRVPPHLQNLVRKLLILIFCAELALALVTVYFAATQGNIKPVGGDSSTGTVIWFTVGGVVCQICTVLWLLRYRRE